jgi:hypothetical protein
VAEKYGGVDGPYGITVKKLQAIAMRLYEITDKRLQAIDMSIFLCERIK